MSTKKGMDKDVAHIYNGTSLSYKKEWIWVSCSEVDEARAWCTEWSKSEREKQISSDQIRSDQLLSRLQLFATPWITARQASLSIKDAYSLEGKLWPT